MGWPESPQLLSTLTALWSCKMRGGRRWREKAEEIGGVSWLSSDSNCEERRQKMEKAEEMGGVSWCL